MLRIEYAKYKKLLLKKKEDLAKEVKQIERDAGQSQRDASGDLSGYTFHMADSATDSYDREFSLGLASNAQSILQEIDEALKRIAEKRFGNCMTCNKPIPRRRLNAVPYAKHCIECQSKEEDHPKRTGPDSPTEPGL